MNIAQRLIILLGLIAIFLSALYPRWEAIVPACASAWDENESHWVDFRLFLGRRMVFHRPDVHDVFSALSADLKQSGAQASLTHGYWYIWHEGGEPLNDVPSPERKLSDLLVTAPAQIFIQVPEMILELTELVIITAGLWLLFYPGARRKLGRCVEGG